MIRGNRNNRRWGPAALLFVACVLAGCETTPELAEDANPSAKPPIVHPVRHATTRKSARLIEASVQVRHLGAPAIHRPLPAVVPRPRELPATADTKTPDEPFGRQGTPEQIMASPAAARFEWPVEGKILLAFGPSGKGERNDGINIEAEPGTPIHAAAAGEVTYAGKLKGYGHLILIRHESGYITAYAHAQALMVSVGDRVDRGQVIGLSGKSGDVDAPQLHFEIRQGIKPLDPKPLLMASAES